MLKTIQNFDIIQNYYYRLRFRFAPGITEPQNRDVFVPRDFFARNKSHKRK